MKKLLATILALVMALSLCSVAWATGEYAPLPDAGENNVITLTEDISVTNNGKSIPVNNGVINISGDVTIDGAGNTITAASDFVKADQNHIINVTGGTVTIKNLTIVGNKDTKHGINVYGANTKVTLQNVTIKNCGTAAVVINAGTAVVTNLTTSGNGWGAINVDKGGKLTIDTLANLGDNNQLWSETYTEGEASSNSTITIQNGEQMVAAGAGVLAGKNYYSSRSFEGFGGALVSTAVGGNAIYPDLASAVANAESGATITLTNDVTVDGTSVAENFGAIGVTHNITINGAGKTITGTNFGNKKHLFNVTGGTLTLNNVVIDGDNTVHHGIHVYSNNSSASAAKAVLDNVTIKNCNATALTVNGPKSVAEVTGLTTSGNGWGAINVDKGGKLTIDTLAKLSENAQLWSENNTTTSTINVTSGAAKAVGGGTDFNGKDYYSSRNFEDLGAATITKNGTTTVYKELDKAIAAAAAGDTVKITSDAGDVTVDKNITLDLNGHSTGKLTASGSSKVTVKDDSGDGGINGAITGNVVAANGSKLVSNGDGGYKLEKVPSNRYYYYSPSTTDTKKNDNKTSPKTFDAGVGIYAVSALLSVSGMAWVGKKRHH